MYYRSPELYQKPPLTTTKADIWTLALTILKLKTDSYIFPLNAKYTTEREMDEFFKAHKYTLEGLIDPSVELI
jgi:hypothetical protein